jgi:hypothetical protein
VVNVIISAALVLVEIVGDRYAQSLGWEGRGHGRIIMKHLLGLPAILLIAMQPSALRGQAAPHD